MPPREQTITTRRRRTAWWILGILLGALVLLPQLVISIWGSALASRLLTHELEKPVSIQQVSGGWWGSLEIQGLTILDSFEANAKTLLKVGRGNLAGPVWMLILPAGAIDLVVDEVRLELRRLADGEWNVAALQPTGDTEVPEYVPLPGGRLTFRLLRGAIYLQPDDREYSLSAEANSLSLRDQPLEWSIQLSATNGESLSANGSFSNLVKPTELAGSAELKMARLDLTMISALVPQLPLMDPDGIVEAGTLQISLAGLEDFRARGAFEFRNISLPDIGQKTDVTLSRGSIQLAVTHKNNDWTFAQLSLEGPNGNFSLAPGAWFKITEEAIKGRLELRGELDDTGPGSRALGMLIPDPLSLSGPLSVQAGVRGEVSLDAHKTWHERLINLKASFKLTVAEAQWKQTPLKKIVADFDLGDGRLSIATLGASVGDGQIGIQGELAPGGSGLSWLVTDVRLADVFGPPLQTFNITKATGDLTFDGASYHVESQTALRELAFDRDSLGNRELRITDTKLDCAGTLTTDIKTFNITTCRLDAPQGNLASQKGEIDLGTEPRLAINLNGWLGGPFLSALVPELTPKWPSRINVNGHMMVPFSGKTWLNMQWELDANGKKFYNETVEFDNLQAHITKSVGRLDFNLSGEHGPGSIKASGALVLGASNVTTLKINADRVRLQRTLNGSYGLTTTISGSADVIIDAEGGRYSLVNQLDDTKLTQGSKVVARLTRGKLEGALRHTPAGGLWATKLSLVGAQLNLLVRDSHIPLEAQDKEAFKLNLSFRGSGSWLTLAAALGGMDMVRTEGDSSLSLQLEGHTGRAFESLHGTGTLKVARLSLWGHPLADADAAFELLADEIKVTRSVVKYATGTVALEGNIIVPLDRGNRNGHLRLQLEQIPVALTQTFASFKGDGPAKLTTAATINGHMTLDGIANGQLAITADLKTGPITRRLLRGEENITTTELPALHFKTKLLSRTPLQRWTITTFDIGGNGISIQLTDGQFLWEKTAHRIAGALALEMSPEFLEGMALGLIPPEIKPDGKITASGQAQLRVPSEGVMGMEDLEFHGTLKNDKLIINADIISSLRLAIRLVGSRLDVAEGEATLLGGRVWLPTPASINLRGPTHPFNLNIAAKGIQLRTYGGRQVSLGHFLGLLIPVFLFTSNSEKQVGVEGLLQTELHLEGTYQHAAGWSRTVNGNGSFRIDDGAVEGSTLLSGIIAKSLLMPTNVVHNAVAALFSRDEDLGKALTNLGNRAFKFNTIASPITVRNGEIYLQKDLMVRSPEMTLIINGHSNLEGELDYDVRTDLIKRVRLGEITDLPNKIPIIGRAISFLNPFTYLDGIELHARVTGNLLKLRPDGRSDVQVKTSVIDTKQS